MDLPDHYDDLDRVEAAAWALLARGVSDASCLAHTPTLATAGPRAHPSARTVVLRGCDADARVLLFHTDLRSAKVAEIRAAPHGAVHVYEPQEKIQLRLDCALSLETGGALADARWAATHAGSRTLYGVSLPPGTPLDDPAAVRADAHARANFAVIVARIQALEWLYLSARGHRRARFSWADDARRATWLVP